MATRKPLFIATDGFHEEMADADDLVLGGLGMGGDITLGGNKVTGSAAATASGELLAWGQAGGELADLTVNPGGDITLSGGGELVGLPTTPSATGAASKEYVDAVAQGLDLHESVRAATTGPGLLASAFEAGDAIDNVTLVAGDRILIKDQADDSENGIYIVQASGAPVRADDWDTGYECAGAFAFVEEGDDNADSGWVCTNDDAADTTGIDDLSFTQFSGAGQITAGAGLTKTGNTINVIAANGIDVQADSVGVLADVTSTSTTAVNVVSLSGNGVAVKVDDVTLEGSLQGVAGSESLRVKDGGITDNHLDPDINITTTGNIITTAGSFTGDGSGLTNLPAAASTDAVTVTALHNEVGTLAKGTPVHLHGFTDPNYLVTGAEADQVSEMPAIGITATSFTDTVSGVVVISGRVEGLNTTGNGESWAVQDGLYVSDTQGVLTNVRPTGDDSQIQKVALVVSVHATQGIIQVVGAGRTNALPNVTENNLWVGDSDAIPQATPIGDGLDVTPGTELQVDITADLGLHFNAGALEIEIDPTPDTLKADADGLGVTGLPLNFKIEDVATSSNVTASGVNALLDGGEVTSHTHPGSGSVADDIVVNEAIAAGDPVYWDTTNNRIAKGDSSNIAKSEIMGLATEAEGTIGQEVNVVSQGLVTGVLVGATAGDKYYLQNGGGIAATIPTAGGRRIIRIGWAVNATDLWVDIHDYGRRRL